MVTMDRSQAEQCGQASDLERGAEREGTGRGRRGHDEGAGCRSAGMLQDRAEEALEANRGADDQARHGALERTGGGQPAVLALPEGSQRPAAPAHLGKDPARS